jgi:hypothetical protein
MADDNGSGYTADKTRSFAASIGLKPLTTPVCSPQSNGMAESFVKTMKRDYVAFMPKPDAATAARNLAIAFEHYNEKHPHSALKYRSPREFRRRTRFINLSVRRCPEVRGQIQVPWRPCAKSMIGTGHPFRCVRVVNKGGWVQRLDEPYEDLLCRKTATVVCIVEKPGVASSMLRSLPRAALARYALIAVRCSLTEMRCTCISMMAGSSSVTSKR